MVLKGIVVAPRWSATSNSIIGVVIEPLVLELLSQANAVLHLVFGILVKRAWAVSDLLVLFVGVALGVRLTDGGDDVLWSVTAILAKPVSSCLITATVTMVAVVIRAAVAVASVVGAIVIAVRRAMSAYILVEAHLGFLGISILVGGRDHLANPCGWLAVELGAKLAMMESLDEGGDDLSFRDVENRIPHLRKASDVATEELGRFLVDAIQIHAWCSA